jgi:hypothetical protein
VGRMEEQQDLDALRGLLLEQASGGTASRKVLTRTTGRGWVKVSACHVLGESLFMFLQGVREPVYVPSGRARACLCSFRA